MVILLAGSVVAADKEVPPAWVNAVDTNAMERVLFDYTNNVIRSEWAGKDKSIGRELPANLGFQFAVVGDEDVTNRVNAILRATRDAIQPRVRERIEKYKYLGPTLQWLVRSTRQGVTNSTSYLEVNAREAIFEEADFNLEVLTNKAGRLWTSDIPAVAMIQPVFKVEPDYASILPAEPGVDYPDIMPEQTFSTPLGIGVVLRAPELNRNFRYMVTNRLRDSEIIWHSSGWTSKKAFKYNTSFTPKMGFAEIGCSASSQNARVDVMVCQKCDDVLGPPTYISFYNIPYMKRNYDKNGRIVSIEYAKDIRRPPRYDISSIWIPRRWTDEYEYRGFDIHGFTREFPFTNLPRRRSEEFSNRGCRVMGKDYHNDPIQVRKVRYYIEDEELKYELIGEEVPVRGFTPRRRGENKVGWME